MIITIFSALFVKTVFINIFYYYYDYFMHNKNTFYYNTVCFLMFFSNSFSNLPITKYFTCQLVRSVQDIYAKSESFVVPGVAVFAV